MTVSPVGPGQYLVQSGPNTYAVDFNGEEICDCGDSVWRLRRRGTPCKHVKAVLEMAHDAGSGLSIAKDV